MSETGILQQLGNSWQHNPSKRERPFQRPTPVIATSYVQLPICAKHPQKEDNECRGMGDPTQNS